MWYGENRSRRTRRWNEGDLLRYDNGPTALMRVTAVREMGDDPRGIACSVRYYGRAFHSTGTCTGRYHGQCLDPTELDREVWALAHDDNDEWVRGAWGAASVGRNPEGEDREDGLRAEHEHAVGEAETPTRSRQSNKLGREM